MSHLDNIKFHFSNPDGLLHVQLTKARVRYPGVRSLPALQSESGIRPFANLQPPLLRARSLQRGRDRALRPWTAPAGLRDLVSRRQECFFSLFAVNLARIPPTNWLNHCKGHSKETQAPHGMFLRLISPYMAAAACSYLPEFRKAQFSQHDQHCWFRLVWLWPAWSDCKLSPSMSPAYSLTSAQRLVTVIKGKALWSRPLGRKTLPWRVPSSRHLGVWTCQHHFCLDSSKSGSFLTLHVFWI